MSRILTLILLVPLMSGCIVTAAAVTGLVSVANDHIPAVKAIVSDIKNVFDDEAKLDDSKNK